MMSAEIELLKIIRKKFTTCNDVAVDRITITRQEYAEVLKLKPQTRFVRPVLFLEGLTDEVIDASLKEAEWKSGLYRMMRYEEILAETIKAKLLDTVDL